ncbi:MAG: acyl carrier protein [Proteobacteria bacterium]|nr:acyl carrier protein [Pseudomonadota bacterium]
MMHAKTDPGLTDPDQILVQLKILLEEMFEVEPADVVPDAKLYDDLDIDSIDAVDLIARLTDLTGIKVQPEQFKSVVTVADVVRTIELLKA